MIDGASLVPMKGLGQWGRSAVPLMGSSQDTQTLKSMYTLREQKDTNVKRLQSSVNFTAFMPSGIKTFQNQSQNGE